MKTGKQLQEYILAFRQSNSSGFLIVCAKWPHVP